MPTVVFREDYGECTFPSPCGHMAKVVAGNSEMWTCPVCGLKLHCPGGDWMDASEVLMETPGGKIEVISIAMR